MYGAMALLDGALNDDRMYPGGFDAARAAMGPHVRRLKELYADRPEPQHFTRETAFTPKERA